MEAEAGEARGEMRDRLGTDRLGAVVGQPPAAQVQAVEVGIKELVGAQFVVEVERRRDGGAMLVDGPQPAPRPAEEGERRHQHQPESDGEAAHAGADQPHVVIQRQPGHEDVRSGNPRGALHRAQVGEQVGVGQHHPLGVASTAGRVLQEGDVLRGQARQGRRRTGKG